jgi:uncharacterized protein (TIGR02271 family)
MRTVVGLFENLNDARQTIDELVRLGVSTESISVVTNQSGQRELESGARMRLSALDTGDVGRVIATGPLHDVMRGQTGDGASLSRMLQKSGLSSDLADRYAAGVREGETLESIIVADKDAESVAAIMRKHSHIPMMQGLEEKAGTISKLEETKEKLKEKITAPAPTAMRSGNGARLGVEETRTIPIAREELQIGKREIQTGAVRVSVHVVERPVSGDVNLREEVVEIERRSVDRPLREDEKLFRDETIEMREYGEEPLVSKSARVVEEVVLHKTIREHVERITTNIRDTELAVQRPFDRTYYKGHFDRLGLKGGNFDEYVPAYRLGEELRHSENLRGSRWEEIEPKIREQWEAKHPGTWSKFSDSIRHSFSRSK